MLMVAVSIVAFVLVAVSPVDPVQANIGPGRRSSP